MIRESGHLSAVGYWFQIHLTDNVLLSTRADSQVIYTGMNLPSRIYMCLYT